MSPAMYPLGLRSMLLEAVDSGCAPVRLVIPTDLLVGAWRDLFPAERMFFLGGRSTRRVTAASSTRDVTGPLRSAAYVTSDPDLLGRCLLDLEGTGARVVAWLHSHPGSGKSASHPSSIDRRQDDDLNRHFGPHLVGLIATADGYLRVWGRAVDDGLVIVQFNGRGIDQVKGEPHVFRLALR